MWGWGYRNGVGGFEWSGVVVEGELRLCRGLRQGTEVRIRVSESACFGAAPESFIWSWLRLLEKENIILEFFKTDYNCLKQNCRSRPFWLEPERFFWSGSGSGSYSYSYSYTQDCIYFIFTRPYDYIDVYEVSIPTLIQ